MGKARQIAAWLAALLLSTTAWAGQQKAPKGEELVKKLDEIFKEWDKPDMPGGVVGIVQGGEMVFSKGYGLANVELGIPNTDKTVFDVGSISKQFTATCVLLLAEQGKLDIDDPVARYITDLPVLEDYDITIRQMMAHTSGLRDFTVLMTLRGKQVWDDDDVLDVLRRQRTLGSLPDTSFSYSNTGYFLLGEIVEAVSGQSLAEFAEENVFSVLGMENTLCQDDALNLIPGRAFGYLKNANGELIQGVTLNALDGPGGIWTTVGDMMKWTENFRSNKLGKGDPEFFQKMQAKQKLPSGRDLPYGLGFVIDDLDGVSRIQHGGDFVGFHSKMSWYPDQDLAVYTFGNDGTQLAKSLNDDVARLMLGLSTEKTQPVGTELPLSESELKEYEGSYALGSMTFTFKVMSGTLVVQPSGQPDLEMFCNVKDQFVIRVTGTQIVYSRNDDGVISKVELVRGDQKHEMHEATPFELTDEQAEKIKGRYYNFELDLILTVREVGDSLEIVIEGIDAPTRLKFDSETKATALVLPVTFRWTDDAIESVRIDFPSASNMVFQRMVS